MFFGLAPCSGSGTGMPAADTAAENESSTEEAGIQEVEEAEEGLPAHVSYELYWPDENIESREESYTYNYEYVDIPEGKRNEFLHDRSAGSFCKAVYIGMADSILRMICTFQVSDHASAYLEKHTVPFRNVPG